MKHQVLFSLKNNEKIFMNVVSAVMLGALRVKTIEDIFMKHGTNIKLHLAIMCKK